MANSNKRRAANQLASTLAAWLAFFDGAQTDMATAAGFDFYNATRLPGNYYTTEYPNDGGIITTIRRISTGALVARGVTTYPTNGSVVYEETVYQADGATIQRKTRETTTYPSDGSIRKDVTSIL